MQKEKTINLAARLMAEQRWEGTTEEERREECRRVAQAPRADRRCFCGARSMWSAALRNLDCCRKAGVVVVDLKAARAARKLRRNGMPCHV
ncbi:MAG: hypothetical protein C5B60_09145 [Chloroflexi bacterium]|nr:MAG: hypothetical protein C5B60_09145 [Chloroflexota bacterium]